MCTRQRLESTNHRLMRRLEHSARTEARARKGWETFHSQLRHRPWRSPSLPACMSKSLLRRVPASLNFLAAYGPPLPMFLGRARAPSGAPQTYSLPLSPCSAACGLPLPILPVLGRAWAPPEASLVILAG